MTQIPGDSRFKAFILHQALFTGSPQPLLLSLPDKHDPAILSSAFVGRIACDWIAASHTDRVQSLTIYAARYQGIPHRSGASKGERLIVRHTAGAVGMTDDFHRQLWL